jgi:Mn-containing catalase
MPRGPKFDKAIEDLFQAQLVGKARNPELRLKLLRKLSGIKEPPKKKIDEKERKKLGDKSKKKDGGKENAVAAPPPGKPTQPPAKNEKAASDTRARLQAARQGNQTAPATPAKATKAPPARRETAARKR